jgi:choline kinase
MDVAGLPWTEIDFPEDLERARTQVLPAIAPAPAEAGRLVSAA